MAWVCLAARLGTTSSSLTVASAVGNALGGLSSCLAVRILQKDRAQLEEGDDMFFREKSKSPSIEALGLRSSVRWAEGLPTLQVACWLTEKLLGG